MCIFESLSGTGISAFLLKNFMEEPAGGDVVVLDDADEVFLEGFGVAGVDVDREGAVTGTGEGKNASSDGVGSVDQFAVAVVVNGNEQFGEEFPHFKVEVAAVHDSTLLVTDDESSAGGDGGEFVHEVVEEYFLEGVA